LPELPAPASAATAWRGRYGYVCWTGTFWRNETRKGRLLPDCPFGFAAAGESITCRNCQRRQRRPLRGEAATATYAGPELFGETRREKGARCQTALSALLPREKRLLAGTAGTGIGGHCVARPLRLRMLDRNFLTKRGAKRAPVARLSFRLCCRGRNDYLPELPAPASAATAWRGRYGYVCWTGTFWRNEARKGRPLPDCPFGFAAAGETITCRNCRRRHRG